MIQRIQTVYLFIVSMLGVVMLYAPFIGFKSLASSTDFTLNAFHYSTLDNKIVEGTPFLFPLGGAILLLSILSFLTIFQYKKRTFQMRMCIFSIIIEIGVLGLMFFYTFIAKSGKEVEISPKIASVLPVIMLVLTYLAFKGIKKDEALVKSFDRLR